MLYYRKGVPPWGGIWLTNIWLDKFRATITTTTIIITTTTSTIIIIIITITTN